MTQENCRGSVAGTGVRVVPLRVRTEGRADDMGTGTLVHPVVAS